MPTFPINNPKSFVLDLLQFLKQGYAHLVLGETKATINEPVGGIPKPSLASNHPQRQKASPTANKDDVLNEYSRSKVRNQLLSNSEADAKCDFNVQNGDGTQKMISVLKALVSVIKSNPNVELQSIGHFDILFGLVSANLGEQSKEIKTLGLDVVSLVSRNKECVNQIAACEIIGKFLIAFKDDDLKTMQLKVLETLSGLLNVQRMVKEAQAKGAVIYLLEMFCNSRNPQIRECCAELLGKMTSDKLSGPKVSKNGHFTQHFQCC